MLFCARHFIFFASHAFPANDSVFKVFKINTAKHNNVTVQQFRFTIQMVQFCVGFKIRTADCTGWIFWDVTPCVVLDRHNVGLLNTVPSLTHTHTHTHLSLSVSLFYVASSRIRFMVFSIEVLRKHSYTTFGRTPLDE